MPKVIFPAAADGLFVDVLVGLDGASTVELFATGQAIPAPIHGRALIDTGSTATGISAAIRHAPCIAY